MSEQNQKVNKLYNDVREALKEDDEQKRGEKIAEIITVMANIGNEAIVSHKEPAFAAASYFGGFSAIAMMIGALPEDVPYERQVEYVAATIGMVTHAIMEKDVKPGEDN